MADAESENPALGGLRRVGDQRDILGECPVWDDRAGQLYWVDIRRPAIRRFDHASGRVETWEMPAMVGAVALTEGERLMVALGDKIALWQVGSDWFETVAALPEALPDHRFNDGRVDRQGRFWVGTMNNITRAPEGTLYRLDGRRLVPVRHGICIPNSLAWSPDGSTMYFADSLDHRIDAHDFEPETGGISNRRPFVQSRAPAFPDGAATDAQDHLWYAEFNGARVVRVGPDGGVAETIAMPVDRPTACAFGGPDLRTLYITTTSQNMTEAERAAAPLAGALLALGVNVAGLPEPRVAL